MKPSIELWLELETACNLSCKFCYNYWKDGRDSAPVVRSTSDTVGALSALLNTFSVKKVAVSGGEPLLRHDLFELLAFLQSERCPVILTTNGTLLSDEKLDQLREVGVRHFQIALHSHQEDMHDYLSGYRGWKLTLAAMIRAQRSQAAVTPVFVGTNQNVHYFPMVVRMVAELGIRNVIFNRFIPTGAGKLFRQQLGVPTDDVLTTVLSETNSVAHAYGVTIRLGTPIDVPHASAATWSNIRLASCPVEPGQQRWTLGSDLNLRRCNQSGASVGSAMAGGLVKVLAETSLRRAPISDRFRPCGHLAAIPLVQIAKVHEPTASSSSL